MLKRHCCAGLLIGSLLVALAAAADPSATPTPKFEHQEIDKITIGYGLAIADVDGDKKLDILLADAKQIVWYQNPGKPGEAPGGWKKYVIAEKLTPMDNVCIAARDIDGDGKCEVAVGAMWNPGETNDPTKSGAVFYLIRPADPTQKWEPVKLHHEVCTHRMRWVLAGNGKYALVVKPLHGLGDKGGAGVGGKVLAYERPADPKSEWKTTLVDQSMNMTHQFDVASGHGSESLYLGGKQGARMIALTAAGWKGTQLPLEGTGGIGELRAGACGAFALIAAVEPMHGDKLVVYRQNSLSAGAANKWERQVLDDTIKEGHALAVGDFLGIKRDQVLVGWRMPNKNVKVGLKLFVPNEDASKWEQHIVDDNKMAAEDLKVADLDGDGKLDIIAAGRATKNLKIYWNQTGK